VSCEGAGRAWRAAPADGERPTQGRFERGDADTAGPLQTGVSRGAIDDGGFDPDVALAAVEHHVDRGAELLAHMRGGRRAYASEAIGRWRCDTTRERGEQGLCDRM
jgi:hypothetical protein